MNRLLLSFIPDFAKARMGLVQQKVPVHRDTGITYETRWIDPRKDQISLFGAEKPEESIKRVRTRKPAAPKTKTTATLPQFAGAKDEKTQLSLLFNFDEPTKEETPNDQRLLFDPLHGDVAGSTAQDVPPVEARGRTRPEGERSKREDQGQGGNTGITGAGPVRSEGDRLPDVPVPPAEQLTPVPAFQATSLTERLNDINNDQDVVLKLSDRIGEGSVKDKARDNLAALDLVATLEAEQRDPTEQERRVLSRWVGWGAFGQVFHPKFENYDWYDDYKDIPDYVRAKWSGADEKHFQLRQEIKSRLSEDDFEAAYKSSLNAHFTSPPVVRAMWDMVHRLGFTGGRVLEPAMGHGSFFGFQPPASSNRSRRTGVELEPFTGKIAKWLYPAADVKIQGFEETTLPNDYFDLAISNVPFGNFPVHDAEFNRTNRGWLTKQIHNYFFAKSIDKVRPGGLVAFITSHHTMDAPSHKAFREYLEDQSDLVAAIRLPNDAFAGNAGTRVTTDILILQKHDPSDPAFESLHPRDAEGRFIRKWSDTVKINVPHGDGGEQEIDLNQYFAVHPEMMLGVMGAGSGFGQMSEKESGMKSDGRDLAKAMEELTASLPEGIMTQASAETEQFQKAAEEAILATDGTKVGAFVVEDGKLYRAKQGSLDSPKTLVEVKAAGKKRECMIDMVSLRQSALNLIAEQYRTGSDEQLPRLQEQLNREYDAFVKKFGNLHDKANVRAFQDDPDCGLVLSLERINADTGEVTKADIFDKRTILPAMRIESADTPLDALGVVRNEKGEIDWQRMSELLRRPANDIRDELAAAGHIYRDPSRASDPVTAGWVMAEEYLSGEVREKLRQAESVAATDKDYQRNVESLQLVQPKDLTPDQISVRLGANWIPLEYINAFVNETFKNRGYNAKDMVTYDRTTGTWKVQAFPSYLKDRYENNTLWGTYRLSGRDVLLGCLNIRDITVYDSTMNDEGKNKKVVNQKETAAARDKQQQMQEVFKQWLWQDFDRAHACVRIYNDTFNDYRIREYDGSHLTLPGMAAHIGGTNLRKHIYDVVWRAISEGNCLFDHTVGAGKTRAIAATAMELRRLGLAKKPMVVVPNHMIAQWDREFREFYPGAKILTVWQKSWSPKKRKELTAQIATGDWDAVIMTHSSFERIPIGEDILRASFKEQIADIEATIRDAGYSPEALKAMSGDDQGLKKDKTAKELKKQLETLEVNLKNALDKVKEKQDTALNFDKLGVDALLVDEAHNYKNLFFASKLKGVSGLSGSASAKAMDMFVKSQWMQKKNGGRGLIFATGTPIANSVAEMWTMMRYLAAPMLKRKGMNLFDSWAATFGRTVTKLEKAPEGGYRPRTRFSRFENVPEMVKMYRKIADVKTREDLPYLPIPEHENINHAVPSSDATKAYMETIIDRAKAIRSGQVQRDEDNMLAICTDARKASLDIRLVRPGAPDDPNSKVNECVRRIHGIWQDKADDKATQLVFIDMGVPKRKKGMTAEEAEAQGDAEETLTDSIYQDIKRKLLARGIPESEVAFVHDFKTDEKKKQLSDMMNSGKIRVLIGSTEKMGSGLNVQERLFALHHIDCPWRPADIEQREGRIIRQGNMYKEKGVPVQVHRYATVDSFDEYMWQTITEKAKFIAQARRGDASVREMEDAGDMVMTANEMLAVASGNPLIKEKMEIEADLNHLGNLKLAHQRNQYLAQDRIIKMTQKNLELAERHRLEGDVQKHYESHKPEKFAIRIGGQTLDSQEKAVPVLVQSIHTGWPDAVKAGRGVQVGEYAGFPLFVVDHKLQAGLAVKLPDGRQVGVLDADKLSGSADSIMGSIRGVLRVTPESLERIQKDIQANKADMERFQSDIGKPFDREEKLRAMEARKREIDEALGKMDSDAEDIEDTVEKSFNLYFKSLTVHQPFWLWFPFHKSQLGFDFGGSMSPPVHLEGGTGSSHKGSHRRPGKKTVKKQNAPVSVKEPLTEPQHGWRAPPPKESWQMTSKEWSRDPAYKFLAPEVLVDYPDLASKEPPRHVARKVKELNKKIWHGRRYGMDAAYDRAINDGGRAIREKEAELLALRQERDELLRPYRAAASMGKSLVKQYQRKDPNTGKMITVKEHTDKRVKRQMAAPTGRTKAPRAAPVAVSRPSSQKPASGSRRQPHPLTSKYHEGVVARINSLSRTASSGKIDTSGSSGKAGLGQDTTAEQKLALTKRNTHNALNMVAHVAGRKGTLFTPEGVMRLMDSVNVAINKGLVPEGTLMRTGDSDKFPYTKVAKLPAAKQAFVTELAKRLNANEDPVETGAFIHWRMNFLDHFYQDGVGRSTEILAALPFMRAGKPLPRPAGSRMEHFAYAPKEAGDTEQSYRKFVDYYRKLSGASTDFNGQPANPDGADTYEQYRTAEGEWTPERLALHDKIEAAFFDGKKPSESPVSFLMGGGPASGKSTILKSGEITIPDDVVMVDSDEIKAHLPEYNAMVSQKDTRAAVYVHEESSYLSKRIMARSAEEGFHTLVDGTGDNSIENVRKKVNALRAKGQKVVAHYVTVPTDMAVERAGARAKQTGRVVPESFIRATHASVSRVMQEAVSEGLFDELTLWDTRHDKPVKVISSQGKKVTVHDHGLWDEFIAKGSEA